MTMIQLIACIGMITGLFMVLHVSPRELSDSLFARLTAAPGSIRADINETTRRKKAGFLRREITEAQAVLAASGRADKFPMVCFTSLLCFALGACIAIAAGNAFLVPVLAVGLIDKRSYMEMLQLDEAEYNLIKFPQRGVCLYKCGNERYLLEVHAPAYKEKLFGTAGGR